MDTRFFVEQALGATVIFALAALAAAARRKHSAASRHLIWWLSCVAVLLLPPVSLVKPAGAPAVIAAPMRSEIAVSAEAPSKAPAPNNLPSREAIFAAWLTGFVLMLGRLAAGVFRSSQRRRLSVESSLGPLRPGVDVRFSDLIAVPETFGLFRPVVLLPAEAAEWNAERLRVVLDHEFVHIQRRDWLTQLIAQFSACVYWFHPLAWVALRQMRKERELACDDGVLRLGYRNSEYAQHLVDVARSVRSNDGTLSASVAMACRSQLETRVRAILNPTMNRGNATAMMKMSALVCTGVAILCFSSARSSAAPAGVGGVVSDPSGARLPDAKILLSAKGSQPVATVAGPAGEWEIRTLPPGDYRLEVRAPGFRLYQQQITVAPDRDTRLDVQLNLGSIEDTITVQGETAFVPGGAAPQRIRVGGNVKPSRILQMVRPEYPQYLKDKGVSGVVILQAIISREGDVINVQVLSRDLDPALIAAAVDAVKQWKYEPTLLNGVSVEIVTTINVNFALARKQ